MAVGEKPTPGMVFNAPYPFVREDYGGFDGVIFETWKPGIRYEDCGPEDVHAVADGVGNIELTVVGVFKPGRFPERVFFTRKWTDPEGRTFGKGKLLIAITSKFNRWAKGYSIKYEVLEAA